MALDTIDMLVLKALARAPLHGYGIGQRIEQVSGGVFRITLGALYPALQRLERDGHVEGSWSDVREQSPRTLLHADARQDGGGCRLARRRGNERGTAMMRVLRADAA